MFGYVLYEIRGVLPINGVAALHALLRPPAQFASVLFLWCHRYLSMQASTSSNSAPLLVFCSEDAFFNFSLFVFNADEFNAELSDDVAYVAGHDDEARPVLPPRFSFYDAHKPMYTSRRNLSPSMVNNSKAIRRLEISEKLYEEEVNQITPETEMATPATARRARGRRPFAVVAAAPSPGTRTRNMIVTENIIESESIGSSKKRWRSKAIGVTSQNPFNLRTEQRGKVKEEKLVQRMKKKLLEEERLRNPLAQGLPWTTDEPENPVKPPMKEPTEPTDVVLHSGIRAVGRARFDHQVSERSNFLENLNMERERQQKVSKDSNSSQRAKISPQPD
ncbi:hypothetical protein ABZP36_034095 [Zizania latifolia]